MRTDSVGGEDEEMYSLSTFHMTGVRKDRSHRRDKGERGGSLYPVNDEQDDHGVGHVPRTKGKDKGKGKARIR